MINQLGEPASKLTAIAMIPTKTLAAVGRLNTCFRALFPQTDSLSSYDYGPSRVRSTQEGVVLSNIITTGYCWTRIIRSSYNGSSDSTIIQVSPSTYPSTAFSPNTSRIP